MKKLSLLFIVSLMLLLVFTACDLLHEHEWTEATCTAPKTCACGATEGEPAEHNWAPATCDAPQTCKDCGATLGIELVHNWVDATCTEPRTCLRCNATEGEALGHDWAPATCTKPSICRNCEETQGEALGHSFTNYVSDENANCLGDGTKTATCDNGCGKTDTVVDEGSAGEHKNVVHVEAVEPGCHMTGNVEHWYCQDCECVWTDAELTKVSNHLSVILPALGGEVVHVEAKAPGCFEEGNIEHWYCETCEQVWQDEALTQLTNHLNVKIGIKHNRLVAIEAVEPGCHYEGNSAYWICYDCGTVWTDEALTQISNVKNVIIPELGGEVIHVDAKAATCDEFGNIEYWYCEECEQVWQDEARTQLTNFMNVKIAPTHGEIIHVEAVAATCFENGNVEHWYCSVCDIVWINEERTQISNHLSVITPAGHTDLVHVEAKPAACHMLGNVEHWYCNGCELVWTDEALTQISNHQSVIIPALGGETVYFEAVAPACHYEGNVEYWYCPDCDQVWTDEALTQLSNKKNIIVAELGGEVVHVDALPATCDANGNIEYWYCEECGQVWQDEARTQLTNRMNVILPSEGHAWIDATCDSAKYCAVCGEVEGTPIAHHTPVMSYNSEYGLVTYTCATCEASYVAFKNLVYDGSNTGYTFAKNGDIAIKAEGGQYNILAGSGADKSQYMLYLPSNDKNNANMFTEFNSVTEAFGVLSFRIKTNVALNGQPIRVVVMSARNNPNWDANGAWGGNSLDILGITPIFDGDTFTGTYKVDGGKQNGGLTDNTFAIVGTDDWVDVKMFMQITSDGIFKISYYINNQFCNVYTRDLLSPDVQTIKNLDINCAYINGYTGPGTGLSLDDVVFGYNTSGDWFFDEHECVWVDADCENPKHCIACGATEGEALGHTPGAEADCENAQICTVCEKELVAALGHTYSDPKCEEPAVCDVCGASTGEALGHNFVNYIPVGDATCTALGHETAKCERCDATDTREIADSMLPHSYEGNVTCLTGLTCSVCGAPGSAANPDAHVLTVTYGDPIATYSCTLCDYSFDIEIGDYMDGTAYDGMGCNAPNNTNYYTTNPGKANYPVLAEGGYYEFVRKTDTEGAANSTRAQLQVWLPTPNGGANKFAGFASASNSIGYLSFKINAYIDSNFEMTLVDNRTDNVDLDGDGALDNIRWGDPWRIASPVFAITPPADGKAQLKGFGNVLATLEVGEDNYTGWLDVAMQIVLDPVTDRVIVSYFIDGAYVATYSQPLTTHTNAIQAVYINSNNTAAGTGYKIDDIVFGYTAHKHDFELTFENGVLTYNCACGTDFVVSSEVREWNGDGNDSAFQHGPNGKWNTVYNEDGTWGFMFQPKEDTDWGNYNAPGGQMQPWLPSSNRDANTLTGFSTENNAVGVISFDVKTSMTKVDGAGSTVTVGVGKPRNASDWNDGGSWTDDFFNVLAIMDNGADYTVKGGVNSGLLLTTITKTDNGWSEWFNVMMVIDLDTDGTMTTYYYINGAFMASESRNLGVAAADGRYLNPQKIEAFQISGWTYAAETGMMFDNMYFGYTANGHNTLDGQRHVLTETTCGEKSTCSCGWSGYTLAHTYANDCATSCSVCGLVRYNATAHANLVVGNDGTNVTYSCADCGYHYAVDGGMHDVNDMAVLNADSSHTYTLTDGVYEVINNGTANGQHQFWIPGQTESAELAGFTNANNATGFMSFKVNTKDTHNTGVEFKVNANRNTGDWAGPTNNGWSDSSVGIFKIKPHAADATTVALTGYNGADLGSIAITGTDGWTGWIDVVIKIQLTSNNMISLDYYINGAFYKNITASMVIWTYEINSAYICGRNAGEGEGYKLSDFYFGYTLNGMQESPVPLYKEEIAKEDVTNELLTAIVDSKFKQCDQCTTVNAQGGTPVYVVADKNGEDVQALYVSRTYAWNGGEAEQFTEFRFDVTGKATKISFDYLATGSVEKNERYEFTDLAGNKFYADAYVQIKTPSSHPLAGDNYPELSGTDLTIDGEWHTMTYTFAEPTDIINILFNLYHFQGELLVANLSVEFA